MTNVADINIIYQLTDNMEIDIFPVFGIDNKQCTCGSLSCKSPGKHPRLSADWKKIATKNKVILSSWIKKYGNLNWAIPTGRLNKLTNKYLIVIDFDDKDKIKILENKLGESLPNTLSYETGRGIHMWFWSNKLIKNSTSLLEEKVDIRGNGGYVIIPPSKHYGGNEYKFHQDKELKIESILDLPESIIGLIDNATPTDTKKTKESSSKAYRAIKRVSGSSVPTDVKDLKLWLEKGNKVPYGYRNNVLVKLLSSKRAYGAELDELINEARNYRESFIEDKDSFSIKETDEIALSIFTNYKPNKIVKGSGHVNGYKDEYNLFFTKMLVKRAYIHHSQFDYYLEHLKKFENMFLSALTQNKVYVDNIDKHKRAALFSVAELQQVRYGFISSFGIEPYAIRKANLSTLLTKNNIMIKRFYGSISSSIPEAKCVCVDAKGLLKTLLLLSKEWNKINNFSIPPVDKMAIRKFEKYSRTSETPLPAENLVSTVDEQERSEPEALLALSSIFSLEKKVETMSTENTVEVSENNNKPKKTVKEVTIRRKVHPNEWKYMDGQENIKDIELNQLEVKYNAELYKTFGNEVRHENHGCELLSDRIDEFLNTIKTGDVVGIVTTKGVITNIYNEAGKLNFLLKTFTGNEKSRTEPNGSIVEIEAKDLDFGLYADRCEILYRDNVPYGIEATYKANLVLPDLEEDKEATTP